MTEYNPYHYRAEVSYSGDLCHPEVVLVCDKRYYLPGRFQVSRYNIPWVVAVLNTLLARDSFEGYTVGFGYTSRVVVCSGDRGNLLQFVCPSMAEAQRAVIVIQNLFDHVNARQKKRRVTDTMEIAHDV